MTDERAHLRAALTAIASARTDVARREEAEQGWSPTLWRALEDGGFTLTPVPVDLGGSGGNLDDLAAVVELAGHSALPVPLLETGAAGVVLAATERPVPGGPLTLVPSLDDHPVTVTADDGGLRVTGRLVAVPFARCAGWVVVVHETRDGIAAVGVEELGRCRVTSGANLAGEPRDDVELPPDGVRLTSVDPSVLGGSDGARHLATVGRALLMVGAMRRAMELSVAYTASRVQFGRPLNAFQAVQQHLAQMAGVVEQAGAICSAAVRFLQSGSESTDVVLAAKTCAGEASRVVVELGHQVHGTIGWTAEYELHRYTERLLSWRDEDGVEVVLSRVLGSRILERGPAAFWSLLTGTNREVSP